MVAIRVSARIGALIVHAASAAGVAPQALQAATGFDPKSAEDPDARIPLEVENALWSEAERLSGDAQFGLHAAEGLRPGTFDVLDYAIRSAPTVRASLERLARYNRIVHDAAAFTLSNKGDVMRVEHAFQVAGMAPCRHASEFTLASIIAVGRQLAGVSVRARKVEFIHLEPTSTLEHERLFGVRPSFSARVNALELDHGVLEHPVLAADPSLSQVMERFAELLLASRPVGPESTLSQVRRLLAAALPEGATTLADISARLRMSERSLQRRLAQEGTSFDGLLDDLRRELASRHLADPRIAIAEVAYLLGYSEPSAFHRAFRRWTGMTPSEARGQSDALRARRGSPVPR
ncbi:AraC family transcriptional regulator [Corallococcus silvisoli]|uniref:AraC family transcriptional regulator n=1 Tax=Corallococcus silvisoli TaxID=2697031 RepID=UPI00137879DA|nr:AraC family transcriptional regulator [Corallococcus silvisoli]NBD08798.1 helix-turn-helix domain-containing protein [Corallococcus silvisoli]